MMPKLDNAVACPLVVVPTRTSGILILTHVATRWCHRISETLIRYHADFSIRKT